MSVNLYDVIIVVLILFFAYNGFKKGLVLTVLRFASKIVAFIIGRILSPKLMNYLKGTKYYQSLTEMITDRLSQMHSVGSEKFIQSLQNSSEGQGKGIITRMIAKELEEGRIVDSSNILEFLSHALTNLVLGVLSFILIFIIVLAILNILMLFVKGVVSLPVLKQLDKGGGFIFGLLQGVFIAYVFIMVFVVFNFGGLSGEFDNTTIVRWLVQYVPV
jgi:uncharacterized membrane protein required for colicin V production